MSSWSSRSHASASASAPDAEGWRTVTGYRPPVSSTPSSYSSFSRGGSAAQPYNDNSPFSRGRGRNDNAPGEMPSAFSSRRGGGGGDNNGFSDKASSAFGKKEKDPRQIQREEDAAAQRDYIARKQAELEAKKAAEHVDLTNADAFPALGAAPKPKAAAVPQPKAKSWAGRSEALLAPAPVLAAAPAPTPASTAAPKSSWASKMKEWQDEDIIRKKQLEADEERRRESDVYIKLNLLDISSNKPAMKSLGSNYYNYPQQYRSTIMEDQDAFDYNKEFHRADELLEPEDYAQPARVYSPHSPPYPYYSDEEEENMH